MTDPQRWDNDPGRRANASHTPVRPARQGNGYNFQNMVGASLRHARRVIVLVVGLTVLALGTALIVLPGPAFVVIPVGLAILATEFEWARRWLHHIKAGARTLVDRNRHPLRNWRRWFRVSR
ncbi:PGPGW domain-containing protein [Candidatus Binatia bacterium]|nr:PGPGW domain-containing protein [Candidatus Binatia bacterium]